MGCFCKNALGALNLPLLNVNVALPPLPRVEATLSLAASLGSLGLPSVAWQPDAAWLSLQLPTLALSATAMATISALAQLRASVLATAGLDLLVAAQATAFARIVATMSARLPSVGQSSVNLSALIRLGNLNFAIDQIQLAIKLGIFLPSINPAFMLPALPQWRAFLSALFALLPVIAASAQLGLALDANFALNLSAAVRALVSIKLPAVDVSAALTLTAALTAIAGLKVSLGIDPLTIGLPALHAMVAAKLNLVLGLVPNLRLPSLPFCPTLMATSAVVNVAANIHANAFVGLNWNVPPITAIAALRVGLPTVSLVSNLQAALAINAVLPAPCAAMCDATSVLSRALAA